MYFSPTLVDVRHLIKSGQTSFTISLPIQWIKKNKLARGDILFIDEKENHLLITSKKPTAQIIQASISVSGKSPIVIEEEVAQQYQLGASHITFLIEGDNPGINRLDQLMQRYPGFELENRNEKKIVYRDLFAAEAVAPEDLLRKQDSFIRVMCTELLSELNLTKGEVSISHAASYVSSLQRQHVLLRRQVLRQSSLSRPDFVLFFVSRALLKTATIIRDFIGTLNLLDKDEVFKFVLPEFKAFSSHYIDVFTTFFLRDAMRAIKEKERLLMKIESMKSRIRSSQDTTMLLTLTSLLSMYWELIQVSELVYLAEDV